jgi:organic hydroperoxide reductase OsmC/OhrA
VIALLGNRPFNRQSGADWERAQRLLEKAEATCPSSNSLNCQRELTVAVIEK